MHNPPHFTASSSSREETLFIRLKRDAEGRGFGTSATEAKKKGR
jgi:hypothetical protein